MDIQRAKLLEKVTVRTQKIEIDPAQGQEPPISSNLPKCCVCTVQYQEIAFFGNHFPNGWCQNNQPENISLHSRPKIQINLCTRHNPKNLIYSEDSPDILR